LQELAGDYLKCETRSAEQIRVYLLLLALQPVIRMAFMVSNQRNADAIGQFTVKKVIGKTAAVGPAETGIGG